MTPAIQAAVVLGIIGFIILLLFISFHIHKSKIMEEKEKQE
jgi:hypothetical protein